MMGLTRKQRQLLDFIAIYIAKHVYAPTYDEMAEAVGLASKGRIGEILKGLEERGYINRLRNRARAIEIVRQPAPIADAVALHPEVRAAAADYARRHGISLSAALAEAARAYFVEAA